MDSGIASARGARLALLDAARAELVEHGSSGISLRAVARRAGVSHAAPKYHFGDRAGLLTAIAAEGFSMLATTLRSVRASSGPEVTQPLGALGRAYIDFSLAHPALFDLMFRPGELHPADPELLRAEAEAIGVLNSALVEMDPPGGHGSPAASSLSLLSWALAHGLSVLVRDGALQAATETPTLDEAADLARDLTEVFAALISRAAPSRP
jgi:AcrR family transcriptional regulator